MSSNPTASQIEGFLRRFTPAIRSQLRDARARLQAMFPRGFELVFENYNALLFGISPTDRTSDAFLSVTGYPKWIRLFFLHGASLRDPDGLLEGTGKQVRSIRLKSPAELNTPKVKALIVQAVLPNERAFASAPALTTTVKRVAQKQRPRSPASSASPPGRAATAKRRGRAQA